MQHLLYFHTLARRGSFARASEELDLSQSALSRSIQALELYVGTRLIDRERGRTGISLTAAGERVLERADEILTQASTLRNTSVVDGTQNLAFGIGPQFASFVLPSALLWMHRNHPDVVVNVSVGPTQIMLEQLLAGEIEFFISGQIPGVRPPRVRCDDFVTVQMAYSVRRGHPILDEPRITVDSIARYPRYAGSAFRDRLLAESDEVLARLRPTLVVDNFEVLADLTARTDGVLAAFAGMIREPLVHLDFDIWRQLGASRTFLFTLDGFRLSKIADAAIGQLRAPVEGR